MTTKKKYVAHKKEVVAIDEVREEDGQTVQYVGLAVMTRKLRRTVNKRGIADMMQHAQAADAKTRGSMARSEKRGRARGS